MSVHQSSWSDSMRYCLLFVVLLLSFPSFAQDSVPIDSDNIENFQSVAQIDFGNALEAVDFGWFVYAPQTNRFLLIDNANNILEISGDGDVQYIIESVDLVDGVPFANGYYALLFANSDGFEVWYDSLGTDLGNSLRITVIGGVTASAIWVECEDNQCVAYVEGFNSDGAIVLQMPAFDLTNNEDVTLNLSVDELDKQPYPPATDIEAVVRIGRIPLPTVVTSSSDGIVKVWDATALEPILEVDNTTNEAAVFGNINADGTHLVWRDQRNETLYLLNFETGENREIASLNGEYAQWFFLSNDASVILAVNLGGEPNVIAWDTETGIRTDLGNYRDCERPQPDMVRMTSDGTTLIIGCDTGLDIWQIQEDE